MDRNSLVFRLLATVLGLLYTACFVTGYDPIVDTDKGKVRGLRIYANNKRVNVFYGIPYAKAPLGEYRFRHPQPNDPWEGVYNATKRPNSCVQGLDGVFPNFTGAQVWNPNTKRDEDCLYLNVWVPQENEPVINKAVMIWIFGGGFYSGTSTLDIYDAKYLAVENDVIVVSMQYRVGALGYLSLFHRDAPGNAGMFDQVMALDWVQSNIHYFGGNPHNVTLFGESAGAVSVGMHLLSPKSRSKFNRAILQSGAPHAAWAVIPEKEAKRRAKALARELQCDFPTTEEIIACLREVPADKFYDYEYNDNVIEYGVVRFPFVPVVDGSFLIESPEKSLNSGNFKKCPILLGNNVNEASFWLVYFNKNLFRYNAETFISRHQFEVLIDTLFDYHPYYPKRLNSFGIEAIKFQYTHWQDPYNQEMNRYNIDMAVGDFHFICPTVDLALHYASDGSPVYYYVFDHRSSVHLWHEWMGVLHADEINFVFGEPINKNFDYTHHEKKLALKMMKYWSNFAKTGDPNRGPGEFSVNEWPLYTNSSRHYLRLNDQHLRRGDKTVDRGVGPRIQECAFWKHYLPDLVVKTADMSEMEREWKVQFHEWSTKYIVEWRSQFEHFIRNQEKRQACGGGP
ncbi:hypothetical protein ACJMK2_019084 [Sinanodonta woodiana]|uniref:Carboxylic ester hydrolase n=1 Tax=Sinanodonta woodiana TaxID=1069815 RepID=A0ABD3UFC2_SINWO